MAKSTKRQAAGKAKPQADGTEEGRPSAHTPAAPKRERNGKLRVRMYRVGFGDFFLVSVPISGGSKHILIDCGVHAKDLKSIREAVEHMAGECDRKLSLIIMTHRHAVHISGFATCSDIFKTFTVDRVWMPWFENRSDKTAVAIQASLTSVANRVTAQLAATGATGTPMYHMVENITGALDAMTGLSSNQKALDVLHGGFKNKPQPDYYKGGDVPTLPGDLTESGLGAQILGPPIDAALISQMTKKSQQYLAESKFDDDVKMRPFADAFRIDEAVYPKDGLKFYDLNTIKTLVDGSQPAALAAKAAAVDKYLNNQSLVVLFSYKGKNLLFAGDAQWGNWEYFLYGGAFGTPGRTELTAKAKQILANIDFYKVGHHGSANATPKDAVAAMRLGCVGMCSTQIDAYNEVPREPLLTALRQRMNQQLARSDQVAATAKEEANPKAGPLMGLFKAPTAKLFIDYEFQV
jgi:beta-lactamase superfamily II metal-dependent hydrolase